jgi:hypothetical protein
MPYVPTVGTQWILRVLLAGIVAAGAALAVVWWMMPPATPTLEHTYVPEQSVMPEVRIDGKTVHVRGVRAFVYGDSGAVAQRWVERTYDLDRLASVWFVLSPFASWRGPAHAFLSFEFADSQFVSISVEARREVGETYSPLKGLLRRYELMFVVGDEADVIGLRTHVWGDPVFLYPTVATPVQAHDLFVALLQRADHLRTSPEYYNTLDNNCATNLADAINRIRRDPLGWSPSRVLPGYSDAWALDAGLLAVGGNVEEARERYRINAKAEAAYGTPSFSWAVRQ